MSIVERIQHVQKELSKLLPEAKDGSIEVRSLACLESDVALIAVESLVPKVDAISKCNSVNQSQLSSAIGVKKLVFIQWASVPGEFIANAFSPVKIRKVKIEPDADSGRTIAVVLVDEIGLDEIFDLEKGNRPRLAAVLTQHDIEIAIDN